MPALKPEELPELLKALETANIDVKSVVCSSGNY